MLANVFSHNQIVTATKNQTFTISRDTSSWKFDVDYCPMKTTRHTRATEMLSKGVNPAKAAKQLGHDKETFLKTYADYLPEYDGGDDSLMESDFASLWFESGTKVGRNAIFDPSE